ncbi:MAG: PEP-CTERM sorting domain-containing protein [Planctomycetales bacterium]|nr:PEP-CTERM sorting domain-containing protein [Planctomycetales bacterium]
MRLRFRAVAWVVLLATLSGGIANAGLFKMDFGSLENDNNGIELDDWDTFPTFDFAEFDDEIATWTLTDFAASGDNDVTLTILDNEALADEFSSPALGMIHNNPVQQFLDVVYDGVEVPAVVKDDYLYRNPDTAGTELLFRFGGLNPGKYNVTLFLGRTSDANGQYGKIWVESDVNGGGEPDSENTGNFAGFDPEEGAENPDGNPVTLSVDIAAGQYLWYGHMEDNSGGISGMIIRQTEGGGLQGDFDANGVLDQLDIEALSAAVRGGANPSKYDVTGDGKVDAADRETWIRDLRKTYYGDSNNDGVFDSSDFVAVFMIGEYEDGIAGNSTWAEGDWSGDGDFDSSDFVAAFSDGGFEAGPRAAVSAVPEPSSLALLATGMLLLARRRR